MAVKEMKASKVRSHKGKNIFPELEMNTAALKHKTY